MTFTVKLIIAIAVILLLGIFIFPQINKRQLKNMPFDQQVRILMKQANKLIYWKNISSGTNGVLIYIKNKRKILALPWELVDGKMICTRDNPLSNWDYPEEKLALNEDELTQFNEELEKYNKKALVKFYIK